MKDVGALKFRETMWFKKGELDAEEGRRAADSDDDLAPGAVDLLPGQDRYLDDGSLTGTDSASYGVRTGTTTWLKAGEIVSPAGPGAFDEVELAREMKRGRGPYLALVGLGLAAFAGLAATMLF
jgi:hypothetical protein